MFGEEEENEYVDMYKWGNDLDILVKMYWFQSSGDESKTVSCKLLLKYNTWW